MARVSRLSRYYSPLWMQQAKVGVSRNATSLTEPAQFKRAALIASRRAVVKFVT